MPGLAGFEAWIEVEGTRLPEYEVDALEGEPGVVCWIPCEIGKEFTICVAIPVGDLREMSHKVRVRLDGADTILRGNIFQQCTPAPMRCFSDQWVDAARSATRAFQFGTLQLTDDDDYLDQSNEQMGQIEVAVQSVERFVPVVPKEGGKFNDEARIHERSMKALATCVKFGETRAHEGVPPKNFVARGVKDVCTFVFKYRTLDVLIANEIAPREVRRFTPVCLERSPPVTPIRPTHPRKRRAAEQDCEESSSAGQREVKRRKKCTKPKARREGKPRKRARGTPSWTDDSDEEPNERPKVGCGFRLLSPLQGK